MRVFQQIVRSFTLLLIQLCRLDLYSRVDAVKGCTVYNVDPSRDSLMALCYDTNTNFTVIPQSLMSNIKDLTVNFQLITNISYKQFSHLPNLVKLNLDNNGLRAVHPDTFKSMPFLRVLSLKHNQISLTPGSFQPSAMLGLKSLEELDLRDNPLGFVPNNYFKVLGPSLRKLALSSTTGFHVEAHGLSGLVSLEELDLAYAGLTTLQKEMQPSLDSMPLKRFYLMGKQWRCDCHLRWLKIWLEDKASLGLEPYHSQFRNATDYDQSSFAPICGAKPSVKLLGRPLVALGSSGFQNPSVVREAELRCRPQIFTKGHAIPVARGSNVTLVCEGFADPPMTIRWIKDGRESAFRSRRITVNQSTADYFTAQLSIRNVAEADQGDWQCVLGENEERVSAAFPLSVRADGVAGSAAAFLHWLRGLNSSLVLKYTGLAAACVILVLIAIGLAVYCCYGQAPRKRRPDYAPAKPPDAYDSLERLKTQDEANRDNLLDSHLVKETAFAPHQGFVQVCPLPPDQKLDDYVAFQVVASNDSQLPENFNNFSLQRLTLIPTDSTTFIPPGLSDHQIATLPTSASASMSVSAGRSVDEGSSTGATAAAYSPCPLHGNLIVPTSMNSSFTQKLPEMSRPPDLSTFCSSLSRTESADARTLKQSRSSQIALKATEDEGYNTAV